MVVHVGEPSPEDFSISMSVVLASLKDVRLNRDAFPEAESVEAYFSDCAFSSGWVQL